MKNTYKKIIGFLYKNYVGTITFKIGKYYASQVKAARIMFPFMLLWGILKSIQYLMFGLTFIQWWDFIFISLLLIQILAGMTELIKHEYNRLNKI